MVLQKDKNSRIRIRRKESGKCSAREVIFRVKNGLFKKEREKNEVRWSLKHKLLDAYNLKIRVQLMSVDLNSTANGAHISSQDVKLQFIS